MVMRQKVWLGADERRPTYDPGPSTTDDLQPSTYDYSIISA